MKITKKQLVKLIKESSGSDFYFNVLEGLDAKEIKAIIRYIKYVASDIKNGKHKATFEAFISDIKECEKHI